MERLNNSKSFILENLKEFDEFRKNNALNVNHTDVGPFANSLIADNFAKDMQLLGQKHFKETGYNIIKSLFSVQPSRLGLKYIKLKPKLLSIALDSLQKVDRAIDLAA